MRVCVHVPYSRPIGSANLGICIRLDSRIVSAKSKSMSRSRSECRRHENGGAVGTESDRDGWNAVGS